MQRINMKFGMGKVVAVAALAFAGAAQASAWSVGLTNSLTSAGTTGSGQSTMLQVPGAYAYSNTFAAGTGGTPVIGSTSGFFDDFAFTIASASANSITSTINLGNTLEIDNLQVSLFSYAAGQPLPVFGSSMPPGAIQVSGWSTPITVGNGTIGTVAVIPVTALQAGSYVLEVRGTVNGTAGGAYSGTLNLSPVPLPAALPLLLSGLAALGFGRKRFAPAAA